MFKALGYFGATFRAIQLQKNKTPFTVDQLQGKFLRKYRWRMILRQIKTKIIYTYFIFTLNGENQYTCFGKRRKRIPFVGN